LKTISEPLKKFILIGLSIFIYKIVFIAYAYTFNQTQYNLFNQSYYTASILILFGALGFNIAQTRIPIKPLAIFFLAAVNLVMTYSILHLISNPFSEITEIIPVIIYSIFSAVGGVLTFKLLFDGKYQIYFWVMLIFAAAHFMIIPAVVFLNVSIFPALSLLIIIWFFAVYGFFDKEVSDSKNYTEYFKVGFSAFVINSAVSLGLAGDKFIVNHFFTVDIANTYTFAWGLTAPIFYIGNLIEKYLYAEPKPDKSRILKKGFIFSLLLISAYTLGIVTVVKFFPSLLPATISKELFGSIFIFMITGYSLYVILHFPINTYLFKVTGTKKQKIISVYFTFIILFFVFVFYYIVNNPFEITYQMLLAAVWFYIFLLLVVKSFIIFKGKESDSDKNDEIISGEIQGIP
jgi:hypothetical protein